MTGCEAPEGCEWVLMRSDHVRIARKAVADGRDNSDAMRSLVALNPPPIRPGMWFDWHGDPTYIAAELPTGAALLWWKNKGEWFPELIRYKLGEKPSHAPVVDPPENAQELYDLLGIEGPTP